MKTNILIIAALALSLSTVAQNTTPAPRTYPKAIALPAEPALQNTPAATPAEGGQRYVVCSTKNTGSANSLGQVQCTVPVEVTTTAEVPANTPKDCFKMVDNRMIGIKGGNSSFMTEYRFLANGTVVMPNGKVVTNSGKKIYLQNGESIDGDGHITTNRCSEISGSVNNGGTCSVE